MLNKMKKLVKDSIHILKLEYKMNKKTFIYEIMSGLSENAVSVLKVILPALIIDSIMKSDKIDTALWLIAAFAVVISICALIQKRSRLMLVALGYETGNLFNLEVNKKMLRMDYPKTEDAKIHDMKDNAVESLWSFLEIDYIVLNSILGSFFTFITMLYIIATLDIGVFIFILVLSLLNIYVEFRSNKKIYDIEKVQAPYNRKIKYTKELMQGISAGKEIRVFHAKDFFIRQFQSFFEGQYQGEKKIEKSKFKLVIFQSITGFVQMLVLYIIAIDHYKGGLVSLGSFVMYVGVIQSFATALQDIFLSFVELSKVTLYFGNYDKFMKIDESMNSGTLPCKDKNSPCIEFRNVSFRYTNQSDYVLKNINLKISPDDKIALVGENGAGKTTLVKLLVRLYDVTEGEILLDGVNIKNYKYDDYLSLFSPVFQDYMMYFYSFKENIVFDRLDEDKLDKCLETTGLDKKFDELQDGVDTFYTKEFSETGVDLSGGEQQRVAIARAFYKDSPISVLDEPTASLDPITENDIYKQFNENIKGKTAIFISHRMSSTSFCDKIIVLDKGAVVESGTHKELLQRNGVYAQMYDKQSVYYQ